MNFKALGMAAVIGAAAFAFVPVVASADQTMPTCAAGDAVVWENTSTKVYHLKGDKYFGNTKSGSYACKSAADAAGFHVSGQKSKTGGAAASGTSATAAPDAMASPSSAGSPSAMGSPMGKHHHKKKGTSTAASPGPNDTSAPDVLASPGEMTPLKSKHHHKKKGASSAASPAADASPAAAASPAPAAT